MADYTKNVVDARLWETDLPATKHHVHSQSSIPPPPPTNPPPSPSQTSDWTLQTSDGKSFSGAEKAWAQLAVTYGPFEAHKHDPTFLCCFDDKEDGYQMIGVANVYFSLGGPRNAVKDPQGESWDGSTPGAFHFHYVKEDGGLKLKFTRIYSDPSPALKVMLEAGALNGEMIAGMLKG